MLTGGEDVGFGNGIVIEVEFSYIGTVCSGSIDLLDQLVIGMLGIYYKKDVISGIGKFTKNGQEGGFVSVTNVIFAAFSSPGTVSIRIQGHFIRINVITVFPFRQTESKNAAFFEQLGCLMFDFFIAAQEDGT